MSARTAVLRCDAASAIGGGHVMRCLTLAEELQSRAWRCVFQTNPQAAQAVPALAQSGFKILEASGLDDPIPEADLLIVDHYGLGAAYEKKQRLRARKILAIDDLADRMHDCDILLDQTYGRDKKDYEPLVPDHCRVLTGPSYALLRRQFQAGRTDSLARRAARCGTLEAVLVSFGSTDPDNMTGRALRALMDFEAPLNIAAALGSGASHMADVRARIAALNAAGRHRAVLHENASDMAGLMTEADLAIGAGGTTSWERCCMGLPSIVIELADNQRKIARELVRAGAVIDAGSQDAWDSASFLDFLRNLKAQPETLVTMVRKAQNICDGRGSWRLCEDIEKNADT